MPTLLQNVFQASEKSGASLFLEAYRDPAVTAYNRLEPRARTEDFTRSLRAEIRDAMWMLTRQWQMGEFQAEDAGSAIDARLLTSQTHLDRVSLRGSPARPYTLDVPLETIVERESVPFTQSLKVRIGQFFLKLHTPSLRTKYQSRYRAAFPFPAGKEDDFRGQTDGLALYIATQARAFDGQQLLASIDGGTLNTDAPIDGPDQATIAGYADQLSQWLKRQYAQPESVADNAWDPQRLTYDFSAGAPLSNQGQLTLDASRYHDGTLDWFSFEVDPNGESIPIDNPGPVSPFEKPMSFLPVAASFKGMPNPRFWQMEDQQINFGNLNAKTTDQLLLVFAELGLIYGNDWFVIPYALPVNTLCQVAGLVITDVFGDRTLIRGADEGEESNWQHWSMFNLSNKNEIGSYNRQFFLPAALTKTLESDPIEQVNFLRDEMANMVWAVEDYIPDATDQGINGNDAADKTGVLPPPITGSPAPIRYVLGTTVPENWIPFLPVHKPGSIQDIQFQRAAMPKLGSPPREVIKAKGVMLNEVPPPYYVNEEEVPYSGTILTRRWKRARWFNGRTYTWIGRNRETGRGQGSSNLRFDQIEPLTNQ